IGSVQLIELGEVDRVAGTIACPLHPPKVRQRTDRSLDARRDLDRESVASEFPKRRRAGHTVEDMHLSGLGEHLQAHRSSDARGGQLVGDWVLSAKVAEHPDSSRSSS